MEQIKSVTENLASGVSSCPLLAPTIIGVDQVVLLDRRVGVTAPGHDDTRACKEYALVIRDALSMGE